MAYAIVRLDVKWCSMKDDYRSSAGIEVMTWHQTTWPHFYYEMEKVTHEMWPGRASYRQELFGNERFLPQDDTDQPDVNHSLAALALAMRLSISNLQVPESARQEKLTNEAVHTVLEYWLQALTITAIRALR